jgi:two-component system, NtrC family, response regulator AtoC
LAHALIVEADQESARAVASLIAGAGHTVAHADSLAAARRLIIMQPPDLMLLDVKLPDGTGFELLRDTEALSGTQVVIMTDDASVETSVQALRSNVADYLVKPVHPPHMRRVLSRLIAPVALRAELDETAERWSETGQFCQIIGASVAMQRVYRQISKVAGTAVTVFIQGESGTGKELIARAVHELSRRRDRPFLAVNCGALSPHLIESEIFGHEKGSFTGAERRHQGFFERAHGGTLFLDEVTEMPLELQVKLLRVLEGGTFMRVGSTETQQTDVRIIAATNRNPHQAVAEGRIREDLLYRLNVFPIELPPLRDREGDVTLLAQRFLADMGRHESAPKHFSRQALESLSSYRWPGNVRELRNAVQRACVMANGPCIDEEWLPHVATMPIVKLKQPEIPALRPRLSYVDSVRAHNAEGLVVEMGTQLADVERRVILATFEHCRQHKEKTAAVLGISMKTLYNRLKEYRQLQS